MGNVRHLGAECRAVLPENWDRSHRNMNAGDEDGRGQNRKVQRYMNRQEQYETHSLLVSVWVRLGMHIFSSLGSFFYCRWFYDELGQYQ